jgi:transcriptional regulator with XRE-family HTH domain
MSFKSWRERRLLSQERIAEMSGLSLRTVQRLEAGHRVSYASLRALAAAFQIDADLLERELFASNKSLEDFVEIPRWVRILNDQRWFAPPRLTRRGAHLLEALLMGLAVIIFALSFWVSPAPAKAVRVGAVIELACAYLVSVFIRIMDIYKLWPSDESPASGLQQIPRGWPSRAAKYSLALGVGALGTALFYWIAF